MRMRFLALLAASVSLAACATDDQGNFSFLGITQDEARQTGEAAEGFVPFPWLGETAFGLWGLMATWYARRKQKAAAKVGGGFRDLVFAIDEFKTTNPEAWAALKEHFGVTQDDELARMVTTAKMGDPIK